jgi:release factor glutamine methyltransferase
MTLQEWVQKAEAQLRCGPHADRARRDAQALLLHAIRRERAALLASWDEVLDAERAIRYEALIKRRLAGEPIQYILGEQEFYGLPFRVTPDVLIPRPETEHLVENVIEWVAKIAYPRIVDVGTGSGAIAVALAHHLPQANVVATDLSAPALAVAEENAKRNGVAIRFLQGDLLAPVDGETFDIIVSNPPYVAGSDRHSMSVEVREYEPSLALFSGADGMELYRRLIPAAFKGLTPGGLLALEFGYGQTADLVELLAKAGFKPIEIFPDLQGIARVAFAWRPCRINGG